MKPIPLHYSLRSQLIILIIAALVAAQAVSIFLFYDERGLALRTALELEAAGRAANIVRLIEETPARFQPAILRAADSPLVRFSIDTEPALDQAQGDGDHGLSNWIRATIDDTARREIRVKLRNIDPMTQAVHHMPMEMQPMHHAMLEQRTEPVELVLSIALSSGAWLNVRTMFHRPPLQYAWASMVAFLLSAILIAGIVWLAIGKIVGPLNTLAAAAGRLGRGEAVGLIEPTGPLEVRRLTDAFNDMRGRLTRFVEERTRLLAALGHDLRSPLTAMRLRLELLEDDENSARLRTTVDEMQTMVEATLAFARGAASRESHETFDIGVLLRDLAGDVAEAGGSVSVDADEGLPVRAQPTGIRRALRNIVENAVRYGGKADISVRQWESMVEISVTDDGPGIPEERLEDVFTPFVRLENSRSQETGGVGLGLAIARTYIHANGGEIGLKNRPEGGLEVTIRVPLFSENP